MAVIWTMNCMVLVMKCLKGCRIGEWGGEGSDGFWVER
jgi:hypothetical protein